MIKYFCEQCGTGFDEPVMSKKVTFVIDGVPNVETEAFCPVCLSYYFCKGDECQCGKAKRTADRLCVDCRGDLARKFNAFCDDLTAEEEEQLDDWLDGVSIKDRKRWGHG